MNRNMELLDKIKENKIPKHIAVIMDGNGRWATQRGLPRTKGHQEGAERVNDIVESSVKVGIESLTLFAFSTENWKRPKKEVDALMKLLVKFVDRELDRLNRNGIRLNIMGDISKLPKKSRESVEKAIKVTSQNKTMVLNIALNYGGQSEVIYGLKNVIKAVESGKIKIDDLNEENFNDYLYTKGQKAPDLLIRPSGELRISNFMLYQIAYTEFYFSDILWPDFKEEQYFEAILDFQDRNRRFGGI